MKNMIICEKAFKFQAHEYFLKGKGCSSMVTRQQKMSFMIANGAATICPILNIIYFGLIMDKCFEEVQNVKKFLR